MDSCDLFASFFPVQPDQEKCCNNPEQKCDNNECPLDCATLTTLFTLANNLGFFGSVKSPVARRVKRKHRLSRN